MKLYHGGLIEVQHPKIIAAEHVGDFGTGFYTTTDFEQARRFVRTKCFRNKIPCGIVSCFEAPDDLLKNPNLRVQIFTQADEAWVKFVESNRTQAGWTHDFDVVYGPVANDQVYASFALYENELIDFPELLNRLKIRKLTDQVLFHTEKALSELKFAGSENVPCQPK